MQKIVRLFLILLIVTPGPSLACTIPPPYLYEHHTTLVMKSKAIVLAKAVAIIDKEPSGYATFVFEPVETLKGEAPASIERYGMTAGGFAARRHGIDGSDFEGHKSPDFWAWTGGNGAILPSCGLYGIFEVGETYLLFVRDEPHNRAQEKILEDDDLWLAVVRLVAENYGEGILEDFFDAPESDSLAHCIEEVVTNEEYLYVRHFLIDACIDRHAAE